MRDGRRTGGMSSQKEADGPILSPLSTCLAESRRDLASSPDLSRLSVSVWIFWLKLELRGKLPSNIHVSPVRTEELPAHFYSKQTSSRSLFLTVFEDCCSISGPLCGPSNDWGHMGLFIYSSIFPDTPHPWDLAHLHENRDNVGMFHDLQGREASGVGGSYPHGSWSFGWSFHLAVRVVYPLVSALQTYHDARMHFGNAPSVWVKLFS